MTSQDREKLNKIYGKGNWRIKLGHGGAETLFVKRDIKFEFESYEYNRVLK